MISVVELRQQLETTEKESDEEKQKLAQELSRGKQAVISLMQVRKPVRLGKKKKKNLSHSFFLYTQQAPISSATMLHCNFMVTTTVMI